MRACGRWSGEEDALRHRLVEHLGARELGLQDGEVVAIAGGAVAGRKQMPQALEPFAQQASILPAESSSHTRCISLGSAQCLMQLSSASNATPRLASCRLRYSWPLMQGLAL